MDGARIANAAASLRTQSPAGDARSRRRRAFVRRNQEWRRWGPRRPCFFDKAAGASIFFTCASKACSLPRKCVSSPRSSRRCSPATCGERMHSTPIAWRSCWRRNCANFRRSRSPTGGSQRSVRVDSPPGHRQNPLPLLLLYVERRAGHGALDVLVRYDGRRRQPVCGVCGEESLG